MTNRNLLPDILGLLLLCSLMIDAIAASNCTNQCGNITILYPFGMDRSECFLDEWYEIDCQHGNFTFLKKLGLEVLNISLPLYYYNRPDRYTVMSSEIVTVNFPIMYSNDSACSTSKVNSNSTPPPSLKGSPFGFSSSNVFNAVGRCNVGATLTGSNHSFVGCKLECSGGDLLSRCQSTETPDGLQTLTVDFFNHDPKDANGINDTLCSYAFLASKSWSDSVTDSESLQMERHAHAPVYLDWGIWNTSDLGIRLYDGQKQDYAGYDCSESYTYENETKGIMVCRCYDGYDGSPYLKDGCHDINECEDPNYNPCPGRCINKRGWYDCVDPKRTAKLVLIGIGSSLGALLLVLLGWQLYRFIKKRKEKKLKEKYFKRNGGLLLQQHLLSPEGNLQKGKLFFQKELEKATENFSESRVLGKGGQGTVYKGMLTDGRIVAIKKALVIDEANVEQFINEVMILSQIDHRNIVKLLGCCLETEIPLLVYEFIPNGNLYEYLHESNNDYMVSWEVRLQLATEIAGAVSYLHSAASMPIYHRDIKSTNILLDEKYRAKIADFGTSRTVSLDQTHVTTLVQGTIGYLDPEFFQTYQFTEKSDVYSFGVVLVEFLTRQIPISAIRVEEGRNLATHFILSMDGGNLFDILDAQVLNEGTEEEILIVANLARRCLQLSGKNRPTMKELTMELEGIKKLRHLPNIKEGEENSMKVQCQDNFESASARLTFNIDVATSLDAEPLLLDKTC